MGLPLAKTNPAYRVDDEPSVTEATSAASWRSEKSKATSTLEDGGKRENRFPSNKLRRESSHDEKRSKNEKGSKEKKDDDPWEAAIPEIKTEGEPWSELTTEGKVYRVLVSWLLNYTIRIALLLFLLFVFVCSLKLLSLAFRLLGGRAAGQAVSNTSLLNNPVCGLMIGVIVTVLVQSSSTSTSIIVAMVAADSLGVMQGIPMIMGANIGTSVTNTIVSLSQSNDRDCFRRAFGGATVHDMFNWLSVIVLLPIEATTHYLYYMTLRIVNDVFNLDSSQDIEITLLDSITKPVVNGIVQVDKKVIYAIANNENVTSRLLKTGDHMYRLTSLSDTEVGWITLVGSLFLLCVCLILIVKLLHNTLKGKIAIIIKKILSASFPGYLKFLTGYFYIIVGALLTFLVQSSSIFTSALTPLVGIGVISMERVYPLTLGANIGTTATGIIAALASSSDKLKDAIQIALCHLFFNITGIIIWYPIPFMRKVPIKMAKRLGNTTAKYRWFAIYYLLLMFVVFPLLIFGLSLGGLWLLLLFLIPAILLAIAVLIINLLQDKRPHWLPSRLQSWDFLPLALRSLEPMDRIIIKAHSRLARSCSCCWYCGPCRNLRYRLRSLVFGSHASSEGFGFSDSEYSSRSSELHAVEADFRQSRDEKRMEKPVVIMTSQSIPSLSGSLANSSHFSEASVPSANYRFNTYV
ncbi:LOW QUALITY PROTEIN: sodium-dependent phosphate transport protein 2A-like [Diadema antillarum]|uniref:LOW QUALITY PROTEIN: sodium-dependent phosphate transport protein 2A-like n=1 Tax=Diadema antillarum TaxID=105358 RepID=UPI003A8BC78C